MRRFLIAAVAVAMAGSAHAQVFTPDLDEEIDRTVPRAGQVEAIGATVEAVLGAVLDVPVGPIIDAVEAADPERRYRRHGPSERTLRDVAGRGDPYFEERLRDSLYRTTADMADTMEQVAVLAPILRRSMADVERDVADAIRQGRERRYEDRRRR